MKRIYNLLILCVGLFFTTCKKESRSSLPNADPFIKEAKAYFMSIVDTLTTPSLDHPRATAARTVNWDQTSVMDLSMGKAVIVPVNYEKELFIRTTQGGANSFKLSNLTRLLVYQSHGAFHVEVVTSLPDTNYLRHPRGAFSGIVYVEDWGGNSLAKYLYEGKSILKYAPAPVAPVEALNVVTIEVCYQLTGYNYSTASPDGGYAWSEAPVCRPSMVPVDDDPVAVDYGNVAGGGGSGGSAGTGIAGDFSIAIGHNLITNINDYFKCFTNSPSCTYQVMVCVDQPVPGSRTAWSWSASDGSMYPSDKTIPVAVGHTFLVLTEITGGNAITRNVGFYPGIKVTPISQSAFGTLNNDEMHPYNISGRFVVSGSLFFNMLTYLEQNGDNNYNLSTNNCTTFAINALAMGHIYLPSTIGSWPLGIGNDPGDLGEDIRATDFVGMTRSVEQTAHMNIGSCN